MVESANADKTPYIATTGFKYTPATELLEIKNVKVTGDLSIQGSQTSIETTNLKVSDKIIEIASGNSTSLTGPAGFVIPKYNGIDDTAIYTTSSGEYRIGDVVYNASTSEITSEIGAQPLLTRDEISNMTGAAPIVWNATKKRAETSSTLKDITVTNSVLGKTPLIIDGLSGTSTNLQEWKVNGTNKTVITKDGELLFSGASKISTSTGELTIATSAGNGNITLDVHGSGKVRIGSHEIITEGNIGKGTLTLETSGAGLSGSQTFGANESGNKTFTVKIDSSVEGDADKVVIRDTSGDVKANKRFYYGANAYTEYNSTDKSIDFVFV